MAKANYVYWDDGGNDYTVRLDSAIATAGGFIAGVGSLGKYPHHKKNMRYARCKDGSGKWHHIPLNTPTNSVYTAGIGSTVGSYGTMHSAFGDRRPEVG